MRGNPGGWFEIYVQDMARAKRFYESVFQVTLQKLETPTPGIAMWSFPAERDGYGCGGALAKMDGVPSGGCSTIVYFQCDDCAVEQERAVKAGGRVFKPKFAIGSYGHIALVVDSEGNTIGLHSMA
jgi:predicted enzyme related to lactoylglutathione lyase